MGGIDAVLSWSQNGASGKCATTTRPKRYSERTPTIVMALIYGNPRPQLPLTGYWTQ